MNSTATTIPGKGPAPQAASFTELPRCCPRCQRVNGTDAGQKIGGWTAHELTGLRAAQCGGCGCLVEVAG